MLGKEKTENYLKVIYRLQRMHGDVRGVEIADELNVSRPTVSIAIKDLEKSGLIKTNYDSSTSKAFVLPSARVNTTFAFLSLWTS